MRMAILKTVHLRYKTFGRRITLVSFNLAIIAKLKCDDLYNTNYKIVILCYASANLIFAQKQEKARFNRTFQGGANVLNQPKISHLKSG